MAPRWKLSVEALGKIEHASLDVRPLTLLVGPNNSGKSYLTSLLWGLVAMQYDIPSPQGPERDACDTWLLDQLSRADQAPQHIQIPPEIRARFEAVFQQGLDREASRLVKQIFKAPSMEIGRVTFHNATESPLYLATSRLQGRRYASITRGSEPPPFVLSWDEGNNSMLRSFLTLSVVMDHLATFKQFHDSFEDGDPAYLPASRTGFMLLYKSAARRSLRVAFRPEASEPATLDLTTPAFHFVDMMAFGLKSAAAHGPFADEAHWLERQMTGRVELMPTSGVNEYRYHPSGALTPLPMQLSSALVTELAPMVLVLRHAGKFPALVLEEPEAHLHPELQRRVAQLVVRLVRKGVCVWITTHSESFCQQINNFIKLGALPEDKRAEAQAHLGYEAQDYLTLDDVAGHELRPSPNDGPTEVVEMKRTEAGLVMPTFNKAIVRLNNEVRYLDDMLAEGSR